jgi:cyclohexyl-isocyanide hydratase
VLRGTNGRLLHLWRQQGSQSAKEFAVPHTISHIVFPIFERVTQLDFTGPHQVFSYLPQVRITVASLGGREIETKGMKFCGLADLSEVESCDMLCIPGGAGVDAAMNDEAFLREIRRLAGGAQYLTSVCTGSLILGAAGLLRGKRATTHWAAHDLLAWFGAEPDKGRVVRDDNIFTGGGVTAGIDFALTAVAEIFGREVAKSIELRMEYAPAPPFGVGRPDIAPSDLVSRAQDDMAAVIDGHRAAVEDAARRLEPATA